MDDKPSVVRDDLTPAEVAMLDALQAIRKADRALDRLLKLSKREVLASKRIGEENIPWRSTRIVIGAFSGALIIYKSLLESYRTWRVRELDQD